VEVFERARGTALLDWHRRACATFERQSESAGERAADGIGAVELPPYGRTVGKMILYAPRNFAAGTLVDLAKDWQTEAGPGIGDIPVVGTEISIGSPVCSVFADGSDPADCLARLGGRIREVAARIEQCFS
jgi:hypothetical protein